MLQGLATGLTGVVMKPTAGMLEFASKTVSGIGGGIKAWGDEVRGCSLSCFSPRSFSSLDAEPESQTS